MKWFFLIVTTLLCNSAFPDELHFDPEGCKTTITQKTIRHSPPKSKRKKTRVKGQQQTTTIHNSLGLNTLLSNLKVTTHIHSPTPESEEANYSCYHTRHNTLLRFKNQEGALIKIINTSITTPKFELVYGALSDTGNHLKRYVPMRVFACSKFGQPEGFFSAQELSITALSHKSIKSTESLSLDLIPEVIQNKHNLTQQHLFFLAVAETGIVSIATHSDIQLQAIGYTTSNDFSPDPVISHLESTLGNDKYKMIDEWNNYFRAHSRAKRDRLGVSAYNFADLWVSIPFTGTEQLEKDPMIRALWQSWYLSAFNANPNKVKGTDVQITNQYLKRFCQELSKLNVAPGFMSITDNEDWWGAYADPYGIFETLKSHQELQSNILPTLIKYYQIRKSSAARIIQNATTDFLDKKSLLEYSKTFDFSEKTQNTAHDILRTSSNKNIEKITKELGYLSNDEKEIIQIIESTNVRFRHQTCLDLDNERLCILSPNIRKYKNASSNFQGDFLFYALEFSKNFPYNEALKTKHDGCDFGPIAYYLDEKEINKRPCFITLANILNQSISKENFHKDIPQSDSSSTYAYYDREISFTPKNCRSGIALYLIKDLRNRKKDSHDYVDKIKTLIKTDTEENNNIQKVINSLIEPEAHIPRVFRTQRYQKIIHRNYNIHEIVECEKANELMKYLTDKEQCIKILAKIIEYNYASERCIEPALKKIFSLINRQDLPEIKKAYATASRDKPAYLANSLCFSRYKYTRHLLLHKGIIELSDPVFTPFYTYKATTMEELIIEIKNMP